VCYPEYQEAYFYYLTGVIEMDCYAVADMHNDKITLFVPQLDNLYRIWMNFLSYEELCARYPGMEIRYMHELEDYLNEHDGKLYVNLGTNTDSNLKTCIPEEKYLEGREVDRETMHDILCESRVIKNDLEIQAMRWASQMTSEAHCYVLKNIKPGMKESQVESFFQFYGQQNYATGRVAPYLPICGCGPTAATLHYHDNAGKLNEGMTMLTD